MRKFRLLGAGLTLFLTSCVLPSLPSEGWYRLHELREELHLQEADRITPEPFQRFDSAFDDIERRLSQNAGLPPIDFDSPLRPSVPVHSLIEREILRGEEILAEIGRVRLELKKRQQSTLHLLRRRLRDAAFFHQPEFRSLIATIEEEVSRTRSFLRPGMFIAKLEHLRELERLAEELRFRWERYNGEGVVNLQEARTEFRNRLDSLRPAGYFILIDTALNTLSLRDGDRVILEAPCSTGSGRALISSDQYWRFDTPRGVFSIQRIITNPTWRKPDWAFLEEGQTIPESETERLEAGVLGKWAFEFGESYFIHGTPYTRLLGQNVTHGCIRLGSEDLERLADLVQIGTRILIF